jgi:GAF domain-containing protein
MADRAKAGYSGVYLNKYYLFMTYSHFILGNYGEAKKWNDLADANIAFLLGDYALPDHYLFRGLLLVRQWKTAEQSEKSPIRDALRESLDKLRTWSDNCPDNFAHKYYLLSAEIAIIDNAPLETVIDLFNHARDAIGGDDFYQFKALCFELYGEFWLEKNDDMIGRTYIRGAYYFYQRWGADRKTELILSKYPHFFTAELSTSSTPKSVSQTFANSVDMLSVLKSTQAISGEIQRESLLAKLIGIMVESVGAENCCLMLKNDTDGQFYIEAIQNEKTMQDHVMTPLLFTECKELCVEAVQYVVRTGETLIIDNAMSDNSWLHNPYIIAYQVKSVLCFPIHYQNQVKGLVYLENNLYESMFTADRLEALKIIASQAAISIENARLYAEMEEKVRQRTIQLNAAYDKLKELSFRDMLTNLYNRRFLFEFALERISQFMNEKAALVDGVDKRLNEFKSRSLALLIMKDFSRPKWKILVFK